MWDKKEKPPLVDEGLKLLKEIRRENCRQILITQINIRLFEREQLKNPDNDQINQVLRKNKKGLEQLNTAIEFIDEEIQLYAGKDKAGEEN